MRLKTELRRLRVTVCEAAGGTVTMRFREDTPVDGAALTALVVNDSSYKLSPDGRLTWRPESSARKPSSLAAAESLLCELQTTISEE